VGRAGHYFTSVNVGPLFGELLALQFSEWLAQLESTLGAPALPRNRLQIVEAGAHTGTLAKDILAWFRSQRPALWESIEYCIIEPSNRRQGWQRRTLVDFLSRVRWVGSLSELIASSADSDTSLSQHPIRGIIFCNELLDAMPVHRFGWDAARSAWFEWGVTYSNGRFSWIRLTEEQSGNTQLSLPPLVNLEPPNAPFSTASEWLPDFLKALPDAFTIELCPAANQWWAQAAGILDCGKLLAIDYGLTTEELLSPEREGGTLRAYRKHHVSADVLLDPGQQDITAHVNFSTLRETGESSGLKTELFSRQEQFLTRIAATVLNRATGSGGWTAQRTRQFQTLTHPNHLGHSFRVLLQSR
jgi:SAM-dependent MidA family methyltransferase